jgi:hypothetical protein
VRPFPVSAHFLEFVAMRARSLKYWLAAAAVGGLWTAALLSVPQSAAQQPPSNLPAQVGAAAADPPPPKGVEVQTRGPVHEAFATPTEEPQPTNQVAKAPPKAIEEMPPEEKPEGNSIWIGGYWAWDDERSNYLWVSGVWRTPPPNKHWVAGYWREESAKWQWVPGYWAETPQAEAETHQVTYLPKPPDPPAVAAPGAAPNTDSFYVPGQYVWRGDDYAWRAGYWARVQPGYVWVPAHLRWTPYGYIYINGYWDLAVADRGIIYAPVVIDPDVVTVGFVYTPCYVVHHEIVLDAFFVRPCYCHYYFGDYYGPAYSDCGYVSVVVYGRSHYDSVIVYERWGHRDDPRWESVQIDIAVGRDRGRMERPPRTVVEFNRYGRERGLAVAPAGRVAEMHGTRMARLDPAERTQVRDHARAVQQVAAERRTAEAKMPVGTPKKPQTASMAMPKGYAAPARPAAGAAAPARPAAGAAAGSQHPNQTLTPNMSAQPGHGVTPAPHTPGAPNNPMTPAKPPPAKPPPAKPPQGKKPPPKDQHSNH